MTDPTSPSNRTTPPDVTLGSALCTQCGLCCTGALHTAAVLDADEIGPARALGLPIIDREDPAFSLPCPRLDGSVCTIYDRRPRVCGRYKCQILQDLEGGALELHDALQKVVSAKELRRLAESVMPSRLATSEAPDAARATCAATDGSGERVREMTFVLQMTAFNLYLDRNFRNSRDRKALDLSVVGDNGAGEPGIVDKS